MKRFILFITVLTIIGIGAATALVVISAVSSTPLPAPELSFDRVKRVKQLVSRHKPRFMRYRQVCRVSIHEDDLNLLLDYAVSQGLKQNIGAADLRLSDQWMILDASLLLPENFPGKYINISLGLTHEKNRVKLGFVRIGGITVPGTFLMPLIPLAANLLMPLETTESLRKSLGSIRYLSTRNKTLSMVYDWNPGILLKIHEQGKALLIPIPQQEKIVAYTNRITRLLSILKEHRFTAVSLARVISPLFRYAAEQSKSGNPVMENMALIQALAMYTVHADLNHLVSADLVKRVDPRQRIRLTLLGRVDLARHYLISAGLAVSAGSRLSNFAGLAKEVDDADRGSGFSFADMAANRAGVRLGELATGTEKIASRIQRRMAGVKEEGEFMPRIARLPENIMELEFKRRYKDLDSRAYGMVEREIHRRLNQCRVYQ